MKEYACADCEYCRNWDSEEGCLVDAQSIPWDYECPDFLGKEGKPNEPLQD